MTWAGRAGVVCAVLAIGTGVSACKVLQHAASRSTKLTTAAANPLALTSTPSPGSCPLSVDDVDRALGGRWVVSGLPSGGCSYTQNARTVMVSAVPLPRAAKERRAALARIRNACDAGSMQDLTAGAFACRQDSLVEAAAITGNRLLVLYTAAGSDPAQVPALRSALGVLAAQAG